MNHAPLLVLALAVLVPSFSEGVTVSRCELKSQLMAIGVKQMMREGIKSLAIVICEVERIANSPFMAPVMAANPTSINPPGTNTTPSPPISTAGARRKRGARHFQKHSSEESDESDSSEEMNGYGGIMAGVNLRDCIGVINDKVTVDTLCIKKVYEIVLRMASPDCRRVSPIDFFKGCLN